MQPAFGLISESEEERQGSSKSDVAQGVTQASPAQWDMEEDGSPSEVRIKEDGDKGTEVAALRLENAILKAEVDGLKATVAVLTTASGQFPCLRCGEIRSVPDKTANVQKTRPLTTDLMAFSTPRRPLEASDVHRTIVRSACQTLSDPVPAPSQSVGSGREQEQSPRSTPYVGPAESRHPLVSLPRARVPARSRDSSKPLSDDSRADSSVSVEVQVLGNVSGPGAQSNRHPKSTNAGMPRKPGDSRHTISRMEACAKCWPLPIRVPVSRTLSASREKSGDIPSWSGRASTPMTRSWHASAKNAWRERGRSSGDTSKSASRATPQAWVGSLEGLTAPGRAGEVGEAAKLSGGRAYRDACRGKGQYGNNYAPKQPPAPVLRLHPSMKDVDEDERFSHCTMCTFCAQPPPENKPVRLCKGCPRIFCARCLPRKAYGGAPVRCPGCPGDADFPPPALGTEPMMHLLEQLLEHDLSRSFRECPEYMKTAVRNMNLGTMMDKLKCGKYSGRRAWGHFQKDCSLIWENCRYYNDCDELGLPEEGTVIPGVVRCALVLEAMTRRFYASFVPDQQGSAVTAHLNSSPTALQTWDVYRQRVQQETTEARLKQVVRSQNDSCGRTKVAGAYPSKTSDSVRITVATGVVSSGNAYCADETTTDCDRSDGMANDAARGKENPKNCCLKTTQAENKQREDVGHGPVGSGGKRAAARGEVVDGRRRTTSDKPWNGTESATSRDHVVQDGGGADASQLGQIASQSMRSVKGQSTVAVASPTEAANTRHKSLSSCAKPAPTNRSPWMLLDQLGDVAYGFPKKRKH